MPVILIGEPDWRRVFDVDLFVGGGSIEIDDGEPFWYAETAADAWDDICDWHKLNGSPPLCGDGNQ